MGSACGSLSVKETGAANKIAAVVDKQKASTQAERRAHYRHPFSALAEVVEPRTRTRLNCRASDLSFGGIYVDTISPFAVGTSVVVRLTCEGRTFQAGAVVTYALNGMGMGLAFTPPLPMEQASALHSWIEELNSETHAVPPTVLDLNDKPVHPAASELSDSRELWREGTRDLVEILLRKQILTQSEASLLKSKFAR
jgi:hypothetical protein